jgi:hypothetical protein
MGWTDNPEECLQEFQKGNHKKLKLHNYVSCSLNDAEEIYKQALAKIPKRACIAGNSWYHVNINDVNAFIEELCRSADYMARLGR